MRLHDNSDDDLFMSPARLWAQAGPEEVRWRTFDIRRLTERWHPTVTTTNRPYLTIEYTTAGEPLRTSLAGSEGPDVGSEGQNGGSGA